MFLCRGGRLRESDEPGDRTGLEDSTRLTQMGDNDV